MRLLLTATVGSRLCLRWLELLGLLLLLLLLLAVQTVVLPRIVASEQSGGEVQSAYVSMSGRGRGGKQVGRRGGAHGREGK